MIEFEDIRAESLFQQADTLINEKKYEDAFLILKSLIERDPPLGKAFNHMGWFYQWKIKDYKKAGEYYKKSIELSPEYYAGYSNYIYVLAAMQQWKELEETITKALTVPNANRVNLFKELGIMKEKQGKYQDAIDVYKKGAAEAIETEEFQEAMKSVDRCKEKMKLLG